jgi:hypothetical protein
MKPPTKPQLPACEEQPPWETQGRSLIHLPIIHTEADLGALRQAVKAMTIRKLGQAGWERNVNVIDEVWTHLEKTIAGWSLPYARLRLYQDGLPVCGREKDIVADLAKAGSRNHQLLLRLMRQGATLMGTEPPELLVQEYRLVKRILAAGDPHRAAHLEARYQTLSRSLLKQRDQAIAERINLTLAPGEMGLLFLGMLHSLEGCLAKDIRVTYPIFPPLGANDHKE